MDEMKRRANEYKIEAEDASRILETLKRTQNVGQRVADFVDQHIVLNKFEEKHMPVF